MNRRTFTSRALGSSASLKRSWKYYEGNRLVTSIQAFYKLAHKDRAHVNSNPVEIPIMYWGPTVEGPDAEYIKVVSGKVDNRKPVYA